jgi:hypothetical protein
MRGASTRGVLVTHSPRECSCRSISSTRQRKRLITTLPSYSANVPSHHRARPPTLKSSRNVESDVSSTTSQWLRFLKYFQKN